MQVTKRDEIAVKVLIDILASAKHDLKGTEILAVARVMEWAAELKKRIEIDLSTPPAAPTSRPAEVKQNETPKREKKVKKNGAE